MKILLKLFMCTVLNLGNNQLLILSKNNADTLVAGSTGTPEMKLFDCNNDYRCTAKVVDILDGCYAVDYANTNNNIAFGGGEGIVFLVGATDVD